MDKQTAYVAATAGAMSVFFTLAAMKIKKNLIEIDTPMDPDLEIKEGRQTYLNNISYLQRDKDRENTDKQRKLQQQLNDDLFIIGIIKPSETGLLCFEDFDRIFRIIQKHATLRLDLLLEEEK